MRIGRKVFINEARHFSLPIVQFSLQGGDLRLSFEARGFRIRAIYFRDQTMLDLSMFDVKYAGHASRRLVW